MYATHMIEVDLSIKLEVAYHTLLQKYVDVFLEQVIRLPPKREINLSI